ncbi:MAG: DUF3833 domain-containing protein [Beijerinckiaceae bacterium]|nr:DUF3833 domain-containing protein [Beijerinckiaceae bacterium]
MLRRDLILGGAASLAALAGGGAAEAAGQRLVLHEWFRGPTHAVGRFRNNFTGEERKLAVDLRGRWNGRVLALFEDFFYADGERDQKTWFFERTGEGRYIGTREDVVAPAMVTTPAPDTVRFGYTADLKLASGVQRLDFDDTLTLRADGTVFNKAYVSRFFIPLGDVELVFHKGRLPTRLKRTGGA